MEFQHKIIEKNIYLIESVGHITLYNSGTLCNFYLRLIDEGAAKFIIDFEKTDYIDSSGLGALIHINATSLHRNIRVHFINFTNSVFKVIKLTKLNNALPISENFKKALNELKHETEFENLNMKQLVVDGSSPLLNKENMHYLESKIGLSEIRHLSASITHNAPENIRGLNLLEQQISELIKNAVKHGNKSDKTKSVKIWFSFGNSHAHLIIEDEGVGFKEIEEWNAFFKIKNKLYNDRDFGKLTKFLSFRTKNSDDFDGGNALFAALEYWNQGVVFNEKSNCIAVKRIF